MRIIVKFLWKWEELKSWFNIKIYMLFHG